MARANYLVREFKALCSKLFKNVIFTANMILILLQFSSVIKLPSTGRKASAAATASGAVEGFENDMSNQMTWTPGKLNEMKQKAKEEGQQEEGEEEQDGFGNLLNIVPYVS